MPEKVVSIEPDVRWEPNAPMAALAMDDDGTAHLALNAHFDDEDHRCVVLVWTGVAGIRMGLPNDEARHLHRLHDRGLKDLLWLGEVLGSAWVTELASMSANPPGRHFVVPLKEDTVEVVAADLAVERRSGATREATSR